MRSPLILLLVLSAPSQAHGFLVGIFDRTVNPSTQTVGTSFTWSMTPADKLVDTHITTDGSSLSCVVDPFGWWNVSAEDGYMPATGSEGGSCAPGFEHSPYNRSVCVDINECSSQHSCQQTCVNQVGSYRCTCRDSYTINPNDTTECLDVKQCPDHVDIIFVLGSSSSKESESSFGPQQKFTASLVRHFDVDNNRARFGALLFSDYVEKLFDIGQFTRTTDITMALIQAPLLNGTTDIHLPLRYIIDNQMFSTANDGRPDRPKVVLMFINGDADNEGRDIAAANDLKSQGVKVLAVGISEQVDLQKLVELASDSKSACAAIDLTLLDYLEQSVADRICPSGH